ncbi:MAG: diguanylate cyclase [Bacilli bacterium]
MKQNEKSGRWKFSLHIISTVFIVIAVFFVALFSIMGLHNTYTCREWNDNWTISVEDTTFENQSINEFHLGEVEPGDTVVLENTIPLDYNNEQISVAFYTYQSTVKAYVDEELVYEYGQDFNEDDKLVPTNLNFIDLGNDVEGMKLRLEITATTTYSYRYIERVYLGPSVEIYSYLINLKFVPIFSSFFIISVGIISIGLALTLYGKKMPGTKTITIGSFLILLGLWISCNSRVILLFNENEVFNTYLEYVTFYIFAIPLMLYFWDYVKENKKDKNLWKIFFFSNIALFLIATILNVSGVFYYPEFLPIFHVFYILIVIFIANVLIKQWARKENTKSDSLLSIGFLIFGFGAFLGILMSELGGFNFIEPLSSSAVLPLSSVLLTIFMIGSYFFSTIEYLYEKGEYDSLTKLAYIDFLTDLSNRTTAVKYMEELDEKKSIFTLIAIDVNNLKIVNDTLGHTAGDQLLINLSYLLKRNFEKYGKVARMGGDEFLVIMEDTNKNVAKNKMDKFLVELDKFNNRPEKKYTISLSYGIASTDEKDGLNSHDIYVLSDKRMYKMKQEYHKTNSRYAS